MFSTTRRSRSLSALAAGLGLTFLATACGGSSDASSSKVATLDTTATAAGVTTTTVSAADQQETLLAFAQCLRDQGLEVADPTFDADGNPNGGLFGPDSGIDPRDATTRTAIDACQTKLGSLPFGPGGGRGFDRTAIQASLNDFTACLRDEGLEVDDIDFSQGGPGGDGPPDSAPTAAADSNATRPTGGFGPPPGDGQGRPGEGFDPTARIIERLGLDATDATVTAAVTACESILDNAFQPTTTTTA